MTEVSVVKVQGVMLNSASDWTDWKYSIESYAFTKDSTDILNGSKTVPTEAAELARYKI